MLVQVQPGDYVSRVAERLELRAEELLLLNADRIPQLGDYLPTGQQLLVCGIMTGEAGSGYIVYHSSRHGHAMLHWIPASLKVLQLSITNNGSVPEQLFLVRELFNSSCKLRLAPAE
jgi:hypothetical protein